jgi:hypothetical protein
MANARTHRTHAHTHARTSTRKERTHARSLLTTRRAQASLAVTGDGTFVSVCGVIDAVPGLRMTINTGAVPTTFPARYPHCMLCVGVGVALFC